MAVKCDSALVFGVYQQSECGRSGGQRSLRGIHEQSRAEAHAAKTEIHCQASDAGRRNHWVARQSLG